MSERVRINDSPPTTSVRDDPVQLGVPLAESAREHAERNALSWVTRPLPANLWRWAVGGLVFAVGVIYYVAARLGSQFFADDFIYLFLSQTQRITPGWFVVDNFGHFAPITRAEYLLVQRTVGLDYPVAALLPAIYMSMATGALAWIAGETTNRRPVALLVPAVTATSVLSMRTSLWFGSGIHVLGASAATLVCVAGFVSFLKRPRWTVRAISVGALGFGLLVQERPILTIGYLVLARYLLCVGLGIPTESRSVRDLFRQAWADRRLWAPYVAVLVVYLVYRLALFDSEPAPGSPAAGLVLTASGLVRTFLPAIAGTTTGPYSGWLPLAAVFGLCVIALIAVWLQLAYRQSWRVWVFIFLTYTANMAILAAGRLGLADAVYQSRDLQYFVDGLLCFPVGILLGIGTLPRRPARVQGRAFQLLVLVTVLAVVGVIGATTRTWSRVIRGNNQTAAHFTLNRAIDQLTEIDHQVDLLPIRMPLDVVPGFISSFVDQRVVLGLHRGVAAQLDVGSANKVVLSPIGEVMHVGQHTILEVTLSDATVVAGGDARVSDHPGGGVCVSGGAGSSLRTELPTEVVGASLFFGVAYFSESDATARAVAVSASGGAAYNGVVTDFPASADGTRFDRLDGAAAKYFDLLFEDGVTDLCLSGLWIGEPTTSTSLGACTVIAHDGSTSEVRPDCSATWPWFGDAT